MKPILASITLALAFCALAFGSDPSGGRIVVPAHDGSHPRLVNCSTMNGAITVKAYGGTDVIVEGGSPRDPADAPAGMHRIGPTPGGLEVTEEEGVITVHNHPSNNGNLVITVPTDISLRLHTLSGAINVEGVHGEVDVHTLNGHVTLTGISGTATAYSQSGPIKVAMDRVDPAKPLAFSAFNGAVDLTFPPDFKANLTVRSDRGAVFSEFEVTPEGGLVKGKGHTHNGATVRGTINGGGVELNIRTFNGGVSLRKKGN